MKGVRMVQSPTNSRTDRQTDRETDRQTDRQTLAYLFASNLFNSMELGPKVESQTRAGTATIRSHIW